MTYRCPTESNFQGDFSKEFFSFNKFVSAIYASKNSSPNKCNKYTCGRKSSLTQSTCLAVLKGENYTVVDDSNLPLL